MKLPSALALVIGMALSPLSASAAEPVEVKFAASTGWLGQLPIMVAIDKGYFAEEGINVKYEPIVGSADRLMALTSGSAEFSNLGRTALLSQLSRGNDSVVWFGNIDQAPGAEGCYGVGGIQNIAGLKGKRVAANTSSEFTMSMLLKDEGLGKADVEFFDLPPTEMVTALKKGDVDAVCIWEPYLTTAATEVPGGKILGRDNDTKSFAATGTVASADVLVLAKSFVKDKPEAASGITRALFKAVDFIGAEPEAAAKIFVGYSRQDLEAVKKGMKSFEYVGRDKFLAHVKGTGAQMQEFAEWMLEQKKLREMPNINKALDTSFVKTK